jgi:preprotein translocase subunit YajC
MLFSVAWAQEAATPAQGGLSQFLPLIFIFVIFYFLIIRPQSQKAKQHRKFLDEMKRGDEVVTAGGLMGRVEGLTDRWVTLEISDDVRIRILKTSIMGPYKE